MKCFQIITACILLITIGCKNSGEENQKLEIGRQYYTYLDQSDAEGMATIVGDNIVIAEAEDNYQEAFTKDGYLVWLAWDSVFDPTYKVLELSAKHGSVEAQISKLDQRIAFLHGGPIIWKETLSFDGNTLQRVERIEYQVFDVDRFVRTRDTLVAWIAENHPELNGFLNDQTQSGAKDYLQAIQWYTQRDN